MAVISHTTDDQTNALNTPNSTLAAGDEIFVGREATLTALGASSENILGVNNHQMVINGELFAADEDSIRTTGGNNVIHVGVDGVVTSANDDGIRARGRQQRHRH